MKVFLDIGAHDGETLRVAQDTEWGFDRIVCFEPAPTCWPALEDIADPRTEVCHFGLWKEDDLLLLNNPGAIGASMSADKDTVTDSVACQFRDAADWFAEHVREDDQVYAKINTEGAEVEIIDRLASAGVLSRIDHLLIHFDVRKIPSRRHLESTVREQLDAAGIDYQSADEIQFGGVIRGTRNWLRWCHSTAASRDFRYKTVNRFLNRLRVRVYPLKRAVRRVRGGAARTTRQG